MGISGTGVFARALAVFARALALAFAVCLLLERLIAWVCIDGDSCGDGIPDGLRGALLIDGVATGLCIVMLLALGGATRVRFAVVPVALVSFVAYAQLAMLTIVRGHHPCGFEYDAYVSRLSIVEWLAIPLLLCFDLLILGAAWAPWRRR